RAHSLTQTSPFPRVHDSPIRNIPTNPRIVIDHQIFESSRRAELQGGTQYVILLFGFRAAFLGFQGATDGTLPALHKRLVSKGPACPAVPALVLEILVG
ncbi:MAG: hypothetical protein ACLQNE_38220, partial [Thermoguttaceae bacterium]